MNDKIKEILRTAKERHYIDISYEESDLLLDYIANLEQENEVLKKNQRLHIKSDDEFIFWLEGIDDLWIKKYINYKSRCEKAIEILKKYNGYEENYYVPVDILLNVLQNGSD